MNDKPKKKRERLASDEDFLNKLVSLLEKEKLTKDELAKKLNLNGPKRISDKLLLSAIRLSGSSSFLSNLIEKPAGRRAKKGPEYSKKRGLVVPAWMFEGKDVAHGMEYTMKYGIRSGIITLTPNVTEDDEE